MIGIVIFENDIKKIKINNDRFGDIILDITPESQILLKDKIQYDMVFGQIIEQKQTTSEGINYFQWLFNVQEL